MIEHNQCSEMYNGSISDDNWQLLKEFFYQIDLCIRFKQFVCDIIETRHEKRFATR